VNGYFDGQMYYRLGSTITNPDQRIADDVRSLTSTTLSFLLMVCSATMTILAFSGVLWSISPFLFGVVVAYAAGGSFLTVVLGRKLVWLNFHQSDKEAYLRASLIHVREHAESVLLLQREGRLKARTLGHIDELMQNLKKIIAVNRNLGFFTTGYNYLIQIIPALIVAPLFIRGQADFGVIPQSAMAFSHLLGAFSLIVNQFGQISSYAAVVARLGSLGEAVDEIRTAPPPSIVVSNNGDRIAFEDLTLVAPESGTALVRELRVTIARGMNVLVSGPSDAAKTALVRATAGISTAGHGRITRPPPGELLVVPERPYLPPGTLRAGILRTGKEHVVGDGQIDAALRSLAIHDVPARLGGLDADRDWDHVLSLGERSLLSVARVLLAAPPFALFDRIHKSLATEELERVYRALDERAITYITIGNGEARATGRYGAELVLAGDGTWTWKELAGSELYKQPASGSVRAGKVGHE